MNQPPTPSERLAQTRMALERHRDYLALLQATNEAANEAHTLPEVLSEVLLMICQSLDWPIGHGVNVEDGRVAVSDSDIWYLADAERYGLEPRRSQSSG